MRKLTLIILICIIFLFNSLVVTAKLDCEIVEAPDDCGQNGALLFKLSDIEHGGHLGDPDTSGFDYHLCCYGIPGLATTTEVSGNKYAVSLLPPVENAHVAIESGNPDYVDYYLSSPSSLTCGYSTTDCEGFDTCLFSVQDDTLENAHVSDCDTGFTKKFCCTAGEDVCSVTGVAWGIVEGNQVNPVETIGMRQMALMIIQAKHCEDYLVDFTIKKGGSTFNQSLDDIPFGTLPDYFGGGALPNHSLAIWWSTDGKPSGQFNDDFTFTASLKKGGESTVQASESDILTVNSQCIALNPYDYTDECDFTEASLDAAGCSASKTQCDGINGCIDADCDQVDDCLDEYIFTSSDSNKCTGTTIGTAGCIPDMDCTDLEWSDCYECEPGDPCDTEGGFAREYVMERCQGLTPDECVCSWNGEKPEGCSDILLNQWDNRFKGCIMEKEFPVFDNWNFLIVVLLLVSYYGIIIYKRKN